MSSIDLSEVNCMSYRIEYDNGAGKYEIRREQRVLPMILWVSMAGFLLTMCFWPEAAAQVRSFLIPGEDAVTIQAFSAMTDDLRSGAELRDAVEGFCRLVIHGQ